MNKTKHSKNIVTFASFLLILSVVIYFSFDLYLEKVSTEFINSWVQSEKINIQEGNYLSAMAKNQRMLFSSQFIKGVALIDNGNAQPLFIAKLGESVDISGLRLPTGQDHGQVTLSRYGPFHKVVMIPLSLDSKNIVALFNVRPVILQQMFIILLLILLVILGLFLKTIMRIHRKEEKHRIDLIKVAINDLIEGHSPSPVLVNEIPTLINSWTTLSNEIIKLKEKERDDFNKVKLGELASQVSHDIRSPLTVLKMVTKDLPQVSEDTRLMIRGSISRINDIANNLLQKNREIMFAAKSEPAHSTNTEVKSNAANAPGSPTKSVCLLPSLIDDIVTEKRTQFRPKMGIEINTSLDEDSYGLFTCIEPVEFKRLMSNLINNAVEVLGDSGIVSVGLNYNQITKEAVISIKDNGRGIPSEILGKLGDRGQTHGKTGGSGLGLYHARTSVESWGGKFNIKSIVGLGTTIEFQLPRVESPSWFVDKLQLRAGQKVVIVDDDTTIHQVWDQRFDGYKAKDKGIEVHHFSTPEQFRNWVKDNQDQINKTLFLMDFELLGFKETGLDLIEELHNQGNAILVTSRYEESKIRHRCSMRSIRLIPKGMAYYVPL